MALESSIHALIAHEQIGRGVSALDEAGQLASTAERVCGSVPATLCAPDNCKLQPKTVFDPESIQVLASAFNDAWDRIKTSGSRFARPGYSRATREVIAKRIFEVAQQGVIEPQTLADDAVRFLTANYKDERNHDPPLKGKTR